MTEKVDFNKFPLFYDCFNIKWIFLGFLSVMDKEILYHKAYNKPV